MIRAVIAHQAIVAAVAGAHQPDAGEGDARLAGEVGDDLAQDFVGREGLGDVERGLLEGFGLHGVHASEISCR